MTCGSSLKKVIEAAGASLAPPTRGSLTEWSREHFRLSSEASAMTGEFRPLPFQVEPLECMAAHSEYEETALMWASQLSKTTLTLAFLAHTIVEDPGPCLVVQPNMQMAEVWSKQRLAPMLRDMPIMKGIVAESKSRDSGSTIFSRSFRGGHVSVASAGSPAGLASRPIRFLILDECDRFEASSGSEGSPSSLAIARTRTYKASRKILWTSSPTIAGASEIDAVFQESDQREYYVPCPHCEHLQVLMWKNVEWPDGEPEKAFYRCESCSEVVEHHRKAEMVSKGCWIAQNPAARVAGFRLSELVSPFRSWGEMAVDWLKAQGNPEKLRAFINTSLAELWNDEAQDSVTELELLQRVENFGNVLPEFAPLITCGVDVQDNRVEASVYAWGRGEESWLLSHRVIPGDPSTPNLWEQLDRFLGSTWNHVLFGEVPISATCIDSGGHFTQAVCRFAESRRGRKVLAIKGAAGPRPIWPKRESKAARGKVWLVGVDSARQVVAQRIKISEGPGRIHWPVTCTLGFFEQLCSEYCRTTYKRGRPERSWVRKKGRAAEVWDCAIYAYSALQALASYGIHVDVEVSKLESILQRHGQQFPAARSRVVPSQWMSGMA